jgi:hypothetical protein
LAEAGFRRREALAFLPIGAWGLCGVASIRFIAASRRRSVSSSEYVSESGAFAMVQPPNQQIDPAKVFEQADCFYQTLAVLCNVEPENTQLAVTIGEPVMVLGALTIELFLKCLICIETGAVPRGHDLRELFDRLAPATQARILRTWDGDIAVHRASEWDRIESGLGQKIFRDLPSALSAASKAFERLRYSYEGNTADVQYFLQDLPQLLGRVILERKPEWKGLRRPYRPLPTSGHP